MIQSARRVASFSSAMARDRLLACSDSCAFSREKCSMAWENEIYCSMVDISMRCYSWWCRVMVARDVVVKSTHTRHQVPVPIPLRSGHRQNRRHNSLARWLSSNEGPFFCALIQQLINWGNLLRAIHVIGGSGEGKPKIKIHYAQTQRYFLKQ